MLRRASRVRVEADLELIGAEADVVRPVDVRVGAEQRAEELLRPVEVLRREDRELHA